MPKPLFYIFERCRPFIACKSRMMAPAHKNSAPGIGLKTMRQRVQEQKGQVHIFQENQQFQLTIILPREGHQ